jgi:[acyl-carrier-protein] S-malonyltransferase
MVAVLGLDRERINDVLEGANEFGVAEVANLNCPEQIVVSGSKLAMDWLVKHARGFGAQRAMRLKVSGAFHSRLMAPASERLNRVLQEVAISQPRSQVVSNVTGKFVRTATEIRSVLVEQLTSPVLWEDSMRYLLASGIRRFVEVGPGRVLSGLLARIDPTVETLNICTPADIEKAE